MITVLIAEDELLIRMGLESSIPWKELSFEIVASVSDGEQAWAAYQQFHPDVLITDIRMPALDGIELIKRIRRTDDRCHIVVITCVEYFDILYKSLDLNITGYLLKSAMTRDSLFRMLSRLRAELAAEGEPASPQSEKLLSLTDRLRYYLVDRSLSLSEFLSESPACFSSGNSYRLCILRCGYMNDMMQTSLVNILKEHLSALGEFYIVPTDDYLCLLMHAAMPVTFEQLTEIFDNIQTYMRDIFRVSFRAAIGFPQSFDRLPAYCQFCELVLSSEYFYPGKYLQVREDAPHSPVLDRLDAFRTDPSCRAFYEGAEKERYESAIAELKAAFGTERHRFLSCLDALRACISDLLPAAYREPLEKLRFETCKSAEEALDALWEACPHYTVHPAYSAGMLKSIRYIHEHYAQELALSELARTLNVSTNYYAILFRRITGFSFSEFLLGVRVHHAADLLRNSDLSIALISERCGFSDAAYFSHYFKQVYRMTPREYRRK